MWAKRNNVRQEDGSPSWLSKGPIGPPVAHTAGWVGVFSSVALSHFLNLPKNWGTVLMAAGFCIPFAVARELAAKRRRL
jgi:hypothetical protein